MITVCEAIAKREGFYVPGSRAARNHNPGNINFGSFALKHGATSIEKVPIGKDGKLVETPRFAFFPLDKIGFGAMSALLQAHYLGLSLKTAIYKWAPPTENDSEAYLKFICDETGLTPDTILEAKLLTQPIDRQ